MRICTVRSLIKKLEELRKSQTTKENQKLVSEVVDAIQKECSHFSANTVNGHPIGVCPDCKRHIKISQATLYISTKTNMYPKRD